MIISLLCAGDCVDCVLYASVLCNCQEETAWPSPDVTWRVTPRGLRSAEVTNSVLWVGKSYSGPIYQYVWLWIFTLTLGWQDQRSCLNLFWSWLLMMESRHSHWPWLPQWLWRGSAGQTQPSSALTQTGREILLWGMGKNRRILPADYTLIMMRWLQASRPCIKLILTFKMTFHLQFANI